MSDLATSRRQHRHGTRPLAFPMARSASAAGAIRNDLMPDGETEAAASDIFLVFDGEVLNIRNAWKLWGLLTGHDPDSRSPDLTVLDGCAPTFYRYCAWSLLTCVVLGLARLLADPVKDKRTGRENVTVEAIWREAGCTDQGDAAKSRTQLKKTFDGAKFKEFRHRVLAHNDKATATGAESADVPIKSIGDAVKQLSDFQARIQTARRGTVRSITTGEGRRADPADVAACLNDLVALADGLKVSSCFSEAISLADRLKRARRKRLT